MHSQILLNNRLMEVGKARLPALTSAMLYGRGVFTTLAVYAGRPFLWSQHWARLTEHARRCGIEENSLEGEEIGERLARLIEANGVREGRARITLLARRSRSDAWKVESTRLSKAERRAATDVLIMTGDPRHQSEDGLALTVSPYRVNTQSMLAGVKSTNYLEHMLAWEEAAARGFDEAVRLNERGEVVAATMGNLFWVREGIIHTPALATGALAGTTRGCVIILAAELSTPIIEGAYDLSHLAQAEEIFVTSAGLGVSIVTVFDFRRYTVGAGSAALRLREAFRQLTLQTN